MPMTTTIGLILRAAADACPHPRTGAIPFRSVRFARDQRLLWGWLGGGALLRSATRSTSFAPGAVPANVLFTQLQTGERPFHPAPNTRTSFSPSYSCVERTLAAVRARGMDARRR